MTAIDKTTTTMASTSTLVMTLDPPSLGPAHPLYSDVTIVPMGPNVNLITIAGQVAQPPPSQISPKVPRHLRAQMELCLSRVSTCLEASGAKVTDMTRLMYYITERAWEEDDVLNLVTEVVGKWLQGHRPASCFLVVKALSQPEYLCEFEAQAVGRS